MPDPSRHAESRNIIESIVHCIPGFKGYLDREYRRDSDQLARTWIADQLQKCKLALDRWQQSLVDAGQLELLPPGERLRSRLDLLQSRVKGAMRGYSGFFDLVRVDEALLDQVYQVDMGLMDDTTALVQTAEQLSGGEGSSQEILTRLNRQIDEFSRGFDKRSELLEGLN